MMQNEEQVFFELGKDHSCVEYSEELATVDKADQEEYRIRHLKGNLFELESLSESADYITELVTKHFETFSNNNQHLNMGSMSLADQAKLIGDFLIFSTAREIEHVRFEEMGTKIKEKIDILYQKRLTTLENNKRAINIQTRLQDKFRDMAAGKPIAKLQELRDFFEMVFDVSKEERIYIERELTQFDSTERKALRQELIEGRGKLETALLKKSGQEIVSAIEMRESSTNVSLEHEWIAQGEYRHGEFYGVVMCTITGLQIRYEVGSDGSVKYDMGKIQELVTSHNSSYTDWRRLLKVRNPLINTPNIYFDGTYKNVCVIPTGGGGLRSVVQDAEGQLYEYIHVPIRGSRKDIKGSADNRLTPITLQEVTKRLGDTSGYFTFLDMEHAEMFRQRENIRRVDLDSSSHTKLMYVGKVETGSKNQEQVHRHTNPPEGLSLDEYNNLIIMINVRFGKHAITYVNLSREVDLQKNLFDGLKDRFGDNFEKEFKLNKTRHDIFERLWVLRDMHMREIVGTETWQQMHSNFRTQIDACKYDFRVRDALLLSLHLDPKYTGETTLERLADRVQIIGPYRINVIGNSDNISAIIGPKGSHIKGLEKLVSYIAGRKIRLEAVNTSDAQAE